MEKEEMRARMQIFVREANSKMNKTHFNDVKIMNLNQACHGLSSEHQLWIYEINSGCFLIRTKEKVFAHRIC
jgi:hypothetical protein